jgi:hypothetical protein
MGYRVHREDNKFKVVEVTNGETKDVMRGMDEELAKHMARALNFGAGFDGRTPDFFLNKLEVSV